MSTASFNLSFTVAASDATYRGLTIPQAHPRVWFTPARLTQARAYFAAHPFVPVQSNAFQLALHYLMTGNTASATAAINLLMAFTITDSELGGVASDNYRWNDWPPIVYDWLYDLLTPQQRSDFLTRYNYYTTTLLSHPWGGPTMPANNYYWGYWRNAFNWAIATYYEQTAQAQTYLDEVLVRRWQNAFLPYAAANGRGGVPWEGTQYGRYLINYPIVPFVTAQNMGRDLWTETPFFQDVSNYLIYSTSPGPLANKAGTASFPQVFPWNVDEFSVGFPPANDPYYTDYMTTLAQRFDGTTLGKRCRQWLANVNAPTTTSWFVKANDAGGPSQSLSDMPLDYYAPGMGYLWCRDSWATNGSGVFWQLISPSESQDYTHPLGDGRLDNGSFQIYSGGRRLTTESTGYNANLVGYGGNGVVDTSDTLSTNGLYVGGLGQCAYHSNGGGIVNTLDLQPGYVYVSVATTNLYKNGYRNNNPYVVSVVRDFVYLRAPKVLVILDRVQSTTAAIEKAFLLHFQNPPTITGLSVLGTIGTQALRCTTLLPAGQTTPLLRIVNETPTPSANGTNYQQRLEAVFTGSAQSHLIHVLQWGNATDPDLAPTLAEDATTFTVAVGTATVRLTKGMTTGPYTILGV